MIPEDLAAIIDQEQEAVEYLVSVGLMHVTHVIDGYRVWGKTPLLDKKLAEKSFTKEEEQAVRVLYG